MATSYTDENSIRGGKVGARISRVGARLAIKFEGTVVGVLAARAGGGRRPWHRARMKTPTTWWAHQISVVRKRDPNLAQV
jgi:hypothetical protein